MLHKFIFRHEIAFQEVAVLQIHVQFDIYMRKEKSDAINDRN